MDAAVAAAEGRRRSHNDALTPPAHRDRRVIVGAGPGRAVPGVRLGLAFENQAHIIDSLARRACIDFYGQADLRHPRGAGIAPGAADREPAQTDRPSTSDRRSRFDEAFSRRPRAPASSRAVFIAGGVGSSSRARCASGAGQIYLDNQLFYRVKNPATFAGRASSSSAGRLGARLGAELRRQHCGQGAEQGRERDPDPPPRRLFALRAGIGGQDARDVATPTRYSSSSARVHRHRGPATR